MQRSSSGTPTAGPARPPRSRRRLALKILLGVLVTALVLVLLGFGALYWGLSGGWDGIRPQAQPDDRAVVAGRAAVTEPLAADNARVLTAVTPVTGTSVASGTADGCRAGQNNWKIKDGYTLRCEAATVTVTRMPDTTDDTLSQLSRNLRDAGFTPRESWDELQLYASSHGEGLFRSPDDSTTVRLMITPAGDPHGITSAYYPSDDAFSDRNVTGVEAATINADGPTLTLIVTRTYFEDR